MNCHLCQEPAEERPARLHQAACLHLELAPQGSPSRLEQELTEAVNCHLCREPAEMRPARSHSAPAEIQEAAPAAHLALLSLAQALLTPCRLLLYQGFQLAEIVPKQAWPLASRADCLEMVASVLHLVQAALRLEADLGSDLAVWTMHPIAVWGS